MQIKQIMSHPIVSVPADATLDQAARLMWEFDCGFVPVIGDEGRLAGVVTDRDICMAAYTQGKMLGAIPISSAMARTVVAVHGEELVEQAEYLMRESQIRRLPVLDEDGRPVGVVSMNDLARLASGAHKNVVNRELVETLAAICHPRADGRAIDAPGAKPVLAV